MIVGIGATVRKVAYCPIAATCNQQLVVIHFQRQRMHAEYGAWYLKSLEPVIRGFAPRVTLPIMNQTEIGRLPLLVPPNSEQEAICKRLHEASRQFAELCAAVQAAIALLRERRTALISAAVTGQIDVRNWKPAA